MRAACRNCRLHHAKRNFKPAKAPGRRAPLSSGIAVTLVMRTAAPSDRTSHPAFTSQTSCGSLAPPIGRSLHVLATWRKGGVQRSETFGVFIDDACHGAQGSGLNAKMPPRGNSQLAKRWSQLHSVEDPAGWILCVQRNIQKSSGAALTQLPLCNSPLLPPAVCNQWRRIRSGAG